MRPDHTGVHVEGGEVGPQREHARRAVQLEPEPAGPLSIHHASTSCPASTPEGADHAAQGLLVDRTGAQEAGCPEGQRVAVAAQLDQADPALLHDPVLDAGVPPDSSQAWALPRVGWPANGSSSPGVKIRSR